VAVLDLLTLFVSHVQVDVRCAFPGVLDGLSASFSPCRRPLVPTRRRVRYEVRQDGQVCRDGAPLICAETIEDLLPLVEREIYRCMPDWHRPAVMLHAAAAERDRVGLLLLGSPGSGKSTLVRQALRLGFRYYSDEITIFDGRQIWGVPRTIQFDTVQIDAPPPDLPDGCDLESYRCRSRSGSRLALPLSGVAPEAVAPAPVAASDTWLVFLTHRPDRPAVLEVCDAVTALQELHQSVIGRIDHRSPDLGALVRRDRCHRLRWNDAGSALHLLERLLARPQLVG